MASMCSLWSIPCRFWQKLLSNFMQNIRFCEPSQHRNKMLCWKKRHPLVLACFKTTLKCMKMIERASISIIYQPSWSSPCHFCRKQLSIFMKNIRFGAPSQHGKWNVLLQVELSIAGWVFHTLPCLYRYEWESFWHQLGDPHCPYRVIFAKNNPNFYTKYQIWSTLSTRGFGCCAARRDMHCCLSVS